MMSWPVAAPAPAGGVPTRFQARSVASNRFVTSRMNLNVLSCGSTSSADVQAAYMVLRVPGERVPACGTGSCRQAAVVSAVFVVQEVSGVRGGC